MNFGTTELLIVLGIILILFGAPRLPKLARSIGQASKEFKRGATEASEDEDRPKELDGEETKKPASPSQT